MIHLVPYSHADWAWTCTRQWHEERYTEALVQTLERMRTDPELTFYIDTWNEQLEPFARRRPDLMPELRRRVAEGRIAVAGGTVCNPHSDRIGGESYVRNLVMGRRIFRKLFPGVDLSVLAFNDVAFGHAQTPQLALLAGYRAYRAYRPEHTLNVKGVPTAFVWKGLDGSEILTSRGHYGVLYHTGEIPDHPAQCWEEFFARITRGGVVDQVGPSQPPVLCVSFGCDDSLPLRDIHDRPVALHELVEEWNRRETSRIRFGTLQTFYRDLETHRDTLPRHEGVIDPVGWSYWFGQIGNRSLRTLRVLADAELTRAETWVAALPARAATRFARSFEELWLRLLKTSPHAVLWLFEEDYAELLREVDFVRLESRRILEDAERGLVPARGAYDRCIVTIRSDLPWERPEWIHVHHVCPLRGTRSLAAVDRNGAHLPVYARNLRLYPDGTLKETDLRIRVRIREAGVDALRILESSGGRRVPGPDSLRAVSAGQWPSTRSEEIRDGTIRLGGHEISFRSGRPVSLVPAGSRSRNRLEGRLFELTFHEIRDTGPYHFGPVVRVFRPADVRTRRIDRFTLETRGRVGPHPFRMQLHFTPREPEIEIETRIDSRGGDGFFRLGWQLPFDPELFADNPWGVEPRDLSVEPVEPEERLRPGTYWGWSFSTALGKGGGITLFGPPGSHGYFFEKRSRRFGHILLKVIRHPEEDWEKFSTRLREGKGPQDFRSLLRFHGRRPRWETLIRRARSFRNPVRATGGGWSPEGTGLPDPVRVLSLESSDAVVSACRREGRAVVVRLFDASGRGARGELRLPDPATAVRKTDLNGKRLDRGSPPELVPGGAVRFRLDPWEIATLRLSTLPAGGRGT